MDLFSAPLFLSRLPEGPQGRRRQLAQSPLRGTECSVTSCWSTITFFASEGERLRAAFILLGFLPPPPSKGEKERKRKKTQAERQKGKKEKEIHFILPSAASSSLNICPSVTSAHFKPHPAHTCTYARTRTHTHSQARAPLKASRWSGSIFENNGNFANNTITARLQSGVGGQMMRVSAGKSLQQRKMRRARGDTCCRRGSHFQRDEAHQERLRDSKRDCCYDDSSVGRADTSGKKQLGGLNDARRKRDALFHPLISRLYENLGVLNLSIHVVFNKCAKMIRFANPEG